MKRQAKVLAVLLMMLVVLVGQSSAQEMGRYIVHTTGESAVNEAARQGVEARAGRTLKELPTQTGLVVLIPDVAIGPIAGIPGVVAVEPDLVLTAVGEVLPWGVDRIDADLAWGTVTGAGVDIAIIDTGIDKDHPDLAVNGGINFVGTGPSWRRKVDPDAWDDDNGHGTHCAGVAAALDNDFGVVGVAPAAFVYGVKVLDRSGSGYLSDIMDGIYWAANNEMEVINLSLGIDKETLDQYTNDRDALQAAVDYADEVGVVVVAAAGNESPGEDTVIYPARFDSVIAVSATESDDDLASFSSTGPSVELAAPGVGIYSTYKDGGYATGDGTSMASPHVAGTVALMIANFVYSRETLRSTAEDLGDPGWDPKYGYGLVDADEAAGIEEIDIHDVAVTAITAPASVVVGDIAAIDVDVANEGTYSEIFDVVLTDDTASLIIGTESVSLAAGASTTVYFSWDTGSSIGDHTLTATAGPVSEETDTTDNSLTTVVTVELAVTDIAITAVDALSSVVQGDVVSVEVTVKNVGNQDVTSDIDVTLAVDATDSAIQTISDGLEAGASAILTFTWDTSGASISEHTLTASHNFADNDAGNDSLSTTVTVTEAGATMHVASIDIVLDKRTAGRNTFTKAVATVTIVDASNNPVEGATVYGSWSDATSDSDSGVTNSYGEVTLESDAVKNASSGTTTFIFTVYDVVKPGWEWDKVGASNSITVP